MKLSNKTAKGWLQFIPAGTRLCKIIHWRVVTVQDFHACSNFLSVWFKTEWFFLFSTAVLENGIFLQIFKLFLSAKTEWFFYFLLLF